MSKRSKGLIVLVALLLSAAGSYVAGEAKGLTRGCVFGIKSALAVFGAGTDVEKATDYCKREAK